MNIFDVRENLDTIVFDHDQQIKDLAAQLLELKQLVTPMMEFKRREWVGLTAEDMADAHNSTSGDLMMRMAGFARAIEAKLREKNT